MHMGQIYIYIEAIQITSSSEISNTNTYHNDCYLRSFVFKFHVNNSPLFGISA